MERQNRVIKERAHMIMQTLPYEGMPKKMRIALICCLLVKQCTKGG